MAFDNELFPTYPEFGPDQIFTGPQPAYYLPPPFNVSNIIQSLSNTICDQQHSKNE